MSEEVPVWGVNELSDLLSESLDRFIDDISMKCYLHSLLLDYITLDDKDKYRKLPERRSEDATNIEELYSVRRLRAREQGKSTAFHNLKGIGDTLLFMGGFFPEYFAYLSVYARKPLKISFYVKQGSGAYADLSSMLGSWNDNSGLLLNKLKTPKIDSSHVAHASDPELFKHLSYNFIGAMKTLRATRLDLSGGSMSSDMKINEEIYETTFDQSLRDGKTRKQYISKREECDKEPVVEIGGKIYKIKDLLIGED